MNQLTRCDTRAQLSHQLLPALGFAALGIVGLAWTGAWLLLGWEGSMVGSAAPIATATLLACRFCLWRTPC
jgi:hypothetical protein